MRALRMTWLLILLLPAAVRAAPPVSPVLAVVVPVARGTEMPGRQELALIYKRKKLFWRDGRRIQPVNLPADHPLRALFSRSVLGSSPEALQEYWNEQYFHGVRPPHVLASEAAVLRFLAETPEGIGYLAACAPDDQVSVIAYIGAGGEWLPSSPAPACDP